MQTQVIGANPTGRPESAVEETPETDGELLRRFAKGDRLALGKIIARYEVDARRVLLGLWDDRHEVDDLCQEVFLRLIQRPPDPSVTRSLRPWLYRTAVNLVRDRARRRRVRQWFRVTQGWRSRLETQAPGAEARAQHEEYVEVLREEIRRLRPIWCEVVVLRDLMGLSPGEAADVLSISAKTVADRLYRARRELARRLEARAEREGQ